MRLRRLLDLRRRQEENARVQLAQSLQRAATLSDEVRSRTEALESALAGAELPHRRSHLDVLREMTTPAILAAQAAEASAMSTVVEIRREWKRAAIRLKGLERLEEKHIEAIRDEQRRDVATQRDDAMTSRFGKETS
jgi:flagellar protein FliJ